MPHILQKILFAMISMAVNLTVSASETNRSEWTPESYSHCIKSLGDSLLSSPIIDEALAVFSSVSLIKDVLPWSIGKPFRTDATNILIPKGTANWPVECGAISTKQPTCWSYPSMRQILCNPAMGGYIESLQLSSIFRPSYILAQKYFVNFVLGHEIGHLIQAQTSGPSHISNERIGYLLRCFPSLQEREDIEAKADKIGSELACKALVSDKVSPYINLDETSKDQVEVTQQVQSQLIDLLKFGSGDDLCLGDSSYDSWTLRIQTISEEIFSCNSSVGGMGGFFARFFGGSLKDAENILRERQKWGWASSLAYGTTSEPYYSRVIGHNSRGAFLTIEGLETGALQTILITIARVTPGIDPSYNKILQIPANDPSLLAVEEVQNGWRVYFSLNRTLQSRTVERWLVSCSDFERMRSCGLKNEDSRKLSFNQKILPDQGKGVILLDRKFAKYSKNYEQFFQKQKPTAMLSIKSNEDTLAVSQSGSFAIINQRQAKNRMLQVELFKNLKGWRKISIHIDEGVPSALLLISNQLLVALEAPSRESNLLVPDHLAVCSLLSEEGEALSPNVACTKYRVPHAMTRPLAMAQYVPDSLEQARMEYKVTSCGSLIVWAAYGWTWIIDLDKKRQSIIPAQGLADCREDSLFTFRAGRLDESEQVWFPLESRYIPQ